MLQGYSPEFVIRVGYISIGVGVGCLIVIAALLVFLPPVYGWPDAIAAAIAWLLPIALLASFVGPGFRLAMKDRKAEARLVQGQLKGAASVSTSRGLGMLMIQTRGGDEQYLVPPARLKQVPGNQVSVVLTVTPNLRHVRSVGVMGQRMVGRIEPPVPAIMKRVQLIPLLTPVALALAVERPDLGVVALERDPGALHVARRNAAAIAPQVEVVESDLLAAAPRHLDAVLANLPYVPDADLAGLMPEVSRYEPRAALAGGPDGLDVVRALLEQADAPFVALEIGAGQAQATAELLMWHGWSPVAHRDLAGIERVVVGER